MLACSKEVKTRSHLDPLGLNLNPIPQITISLSSGKKKKKSAAAQILTSSRSLARTDNPDAIDSEMRSGGDDDGGDDDFYVDSSNAAE